MFAFAGPVDHDGIVRDCAQIAWAARNNTKPGRSGPESWVVQANPQWSAQWLEQPAEAVGGELLAALADQAGGALPEVLAQSIHRWRYALSAGTGLRALWNPALCIGACGDWLIGPRVESAWLSGRAVAERLILADRIAAPDRHETYPIRTKSVPL